nr:unnamed protein product [Callosobruchus chinensis]
MGVECSIIRKLENKALQWYGHVQRMPEHRWPKRVLEWEPPGRRRRGRPALRWEKYIRHAMIDRVLRVGWSLQDINVYIVQLLLSNSRGVESEIIMHQNKIISNRIHIRNNKILQNVINVPESS